MEQKDFLAEFFEELEPLSQNSPKQNDPLANFFEEDSDNTLNKRIEERFNNINNQQFNVLEGFSNDNSSGSKDMNDIIVYLMTCIFVLLLVDYIFKMGKNSY